MMMTKEDNIKTTDMVTVNEAYIEIVWVEMLKEKDGISAQEIKPPKRKFKVQEIMLGMGSNRKPVLFTKGFLKPGGEYQAEILKNGKLRIVR